MSLSDIITSFTRDTQAEQLIFTPHRITRPPTFFDHTHNPNQITVIWKAEGMYLEEFGGHTLPLTAGELIATARRAIQKVPNGFMTIIASDKSIYDQNRINNIDIQRAHSLVGLSSTAPPRFSCNCHCHQK